MFRETLNIFSSSGGIAKVVIGIYFKESPLKLKCQVKSSFFLKKLTYLFCLFGYSKKQSDKKAPVYT